MSATLYLLRQQPERISLSLFQASDTDKEVVFVEDVVSTTSSIGKEVVKSQKTLVSDSLKILTYDDLVEKIFSSAHVIVI